MNSRYLYSTAEATPASEVLKILKFSSGLNVFSLRFYFAIEVLMKIVIGRSGYVVDLYCLQGACQCVNIYIYI